MEVPHSFEMLINVNGTALCHDAKNQIVSHDGLFKKNTPSILSKRNTLVCSHE